MFALCFWGLVQRFGYFEYVDFEKLTTRGKQTKCIHDFLHCELMPLRASDDGLANWQIWGWVGVNFNICCGVGLEVFLKFFFIKWFDRHDCLSANFLFLQKAPICVFKA